MALLFADGFDLYADIAQVRGAGWIDTSNAAAQTFSTNGGRYGGGCLVNSTASTGWYVTPQIFVPGDTFYVAFHFYLTNRAATTAGNVLFQPLQEDASAHFGRLEINSSGDILAYSAANVLLQTAAAALSDATWHFIEIKWVLGTDNVTGEIVVRVNESTVINQTAIDTFDASSDFCMALRMMGSAGGCKIDDFVCFDDSGSEFNAFTGSFKIDTLIPNGDGNHTAWTASAGNDYQCVDDAIGVANDDTDYISSATATQKTSLEMTNLSDTPVAVYAVQHRHRSKKADVGDRTIRGFLRTASTDYAGTTQGLSTDYVWHRGGIWSVNPNTSVAWSVSQISALEAGVEIVS
jgi:hypothetical protein